MKRLIEGQGKNSADEYNQIFFDRKEKGIDSFDVKRWKQLIKYFRGGKLVDLGCLDSLVPVIAKNWYPKCEVWGIDLAEQALLEMKRQYPDVYYLAQDIYHTTFPNNYFDYAVAGELIEHLEDPEKFIKESFRILKNNGMLAISTPLEEQHNEVDGERHIWSFSLEDLRKMLSQYGKVKIHTLGSQFFPYYKYNHDVILAYCKKI